MSRFMHRQIISKASSLTRGSTAFLLYIRCFGNDVDSLSRHTIRPVLAYTVPLKALSRRPGQSTKKSRLSIQSAQPVILSYTSYIITR